MKKITVTLHLEEVNFSIPRKIWNLLIPSSISFLFEGEIVRLNGKTYRISNSIRDIE